MPETQEQKAGGSWQWSTDEIRRAARDRRAYSQIALKGMMRQVLGQLDARSPGPGLWRGPCGHVWDRAREDTEICLRCQERITITVLSILLGMSIVSIVCLLGVVF